MQVGAVFAATAVISVTPAAIAKMVVCDSADCLMTIKFGHLQKCLYMDKKVYTRTIKCVSNSAVFAADLRIFDQNRGPRRMGWHAVDAERSKRKRHRRIAATPTFETVSGTFVGQVNQTAGGSIHARPCTVPHSILVE